MGENMVLGAVAVDLPDLSELPRVQLERMEEAGARVLEAYRVLMKSETNVVAEILKYHPQFVQWDHFPDGDVYDWQSHSQYYYHAHPPEHRANVWGEEHGHFHTFLRPHGFPAGITPAPIDGVSVPEEENGALAHLIAISMNKQGFPVRLFTTNRWVTGEVWYDAATMARLVDCFEIDQALPSWPTNIWITNLIRLYLPLIERMHIARDTAIDEYAQLHPDGDVYEDRELEICSIVDIAVEQQIMAVAEALGR